MDDTTCINYDNVNQTRKKAKPRGKFLRPCAEIDLRHQKPIKIPRHRSVIKNYNSIKTKKNKQN